MPYIKYTIERLSNKHFSAVLYLQIIAKLLEGFPFRFEDFAKLKPFLRLLKNSFNVIRNYIPEKVSVNFELYNKSKI